MKSTNFLPFFFYYNVFPLFPSLSGSHELKRNLNANCSDGRGKKGKTVAGEKQKPVMRYTKIIASTFSREINCRKMDGGREVELTGIDSSTD